MHFNLFGRSLNLKDEGPIGLDREVRSPAFEHVAKELFDFRATSWGGVHVLFAPAVAMRRYNHGNHALAGRATHFTRDKA